MICPQCGSNQWIEWIERIDNFGVCWLDILLNIHFLWCSDHEVDIIRKDREARIVVCQTCECVVT